MKCAYCGHGELPGFVLGWDDENKLSHDPVDTPDADEDIYGCWEDPGLADGYAKCSVWAHAVPEGDLFLAEWRWKIGERPSTVQPRLDADADWGARVYRATEKWPEEGDIYPGTIWLVTEVDRSGGPILMCSGCVKQAQSFDRLPEDVVLRRYRSRSRSSNGTSTKAGVNDLRASRLAQIPAQWAGLTLITETWAIPRSTAQRLLQDYVEEGEVATRQRPTKAGGKAAIEYQRVIEVEPDQADPEDQ